MRQDFKGLMIFKSLSAKKKAPDFIVHYSANCKIKVFYSNATLKSSLILTVVSSSYGKIFIKICSQLVEAFFCFPLSPPL